MPTKKKTTKGIGRKLPVPPRRERKPKPALRTAIGDAIVKMGGTLSPAELKRRAPKRPASEMAAGAAFATREGPRFDQRQTLRSAAEAVIAEYATEENIGTTEGYGADMIGRLNALRTLLACLPKPRAAGERKIGKGADLLAFITCDDGRSIDAIVEHTGWLPHTAQAFLYVQRKAGAAIEITKKNRATGAGPIFRIAPSTLS